VNPMNDPVYRAISTLCEIKGKVTYAEIALVTGIKRQKALDFIIRNKHLLTMDKRGNITGFITHEANVRRIVEGMFTMGKVYKTEGVNYGCDKEIKVHEQYKEKVKHLAKPYCVGGIGDNYWTEYIIVNDDTVKAMNALGFLDYDDVVKEKIDNGQEQVWHSWCTP